MTSPKLRIAMYPTKSVVDRGMSGIDTVCRAYYRLFPNYGIEVVEHKPDLTIVHAGIYPADVAMLHGVYFTENYPASKWEWKANYEITVSMRKAKSITVPSDWVAETVRRDFREEPFIIPHGVFWDEWQHDEKVEPVVLWAKNRASDICDPGSINILAKRFPRVKFITTFKPSGDLPNIVEIGTQPYETMKRLIQRSSVVLSTVKETWGIMYIEAMAAGTPVLTVRAGHVPNLVQHGVCGYAYRPNDADDMAAGLEYCMTHRSVLSNNARIIARQHTWDNAVKMLRDVLDLTMERKITNG